MRIILAGLFAAGVSWLVNRWLIGREGRRAMAGLGPVAEEVLKTGASWVAGAPLLPVHAVFGAVEFVYDLAHSKRPGRGAPAGAAALLGHLLFGYLTGVSYLGSGRLWAGLLAGVLAHLAWNRLILKLAGCRRLS